MAEDKDAARLKMKADANFNRNLRYKDSRLRTIGIDVQGLNEQVLEKRRLKEEELEAARLEKLRNEEIESILDAIAEEEKQLRAQAAADMKRQWDDQANFKKTMKAETRAKEIDDFRNGPSMQFAGEDKLHSDRKRAQQEQVRKWTDEDRQIREDRAAKQREEDLARHALSESLAEFRAAQEAEEANMKKELTMRILAENKKLAEEKARVRLEEMKKFNSDLNNTLVLNKDTELDENGYPISKGEFRGLSQGQQKQILLENEELIRLKREAEENRKRDDENWYRESLRLQRAMAEAELDEQRMRSTLRDDQLNTLRDQAQEQSERKAKDKVDKFGTISGDYYSKFGTSCR